MFCMRGVRAAITHRLNFPVTSLNIPICESWVRKLRYSSFEEGVKT